MKPVTGYVLRFTAGFLAVVAIAAAIWPVIPRRYEAPATVVLLVSNRDDDPAAAIKTIRQTPDEYETQSDIDLLSSPDLTAKVVAENHLIDDREFNGSEGLYERLRSINVLGALLPPRPPVSAQTVRQKLLKRLTVNHDRRSYTVSFGYWSEDPLKAAILTRSLLAAYMDSERARKSASIDRVTHWLGDRVANLRVQADKMDDAVERFMRESGLMDRGADAFLESQLTALSGDYATVSARAIKNTALLSSLMTMRTAGHLEEAPEVAASPIVQSLKQTRAVAAIEPGRLTSESSGSTAQIALEANRIVDSTAAQIRIDHRQAGDLAVAIHDVRAAIERRAQAKLQLASLERNAKASHSVLEDSLVRLNGQTSLALSIAPEIEVVAQVEAPLQAMFPDPLMTCLGTLLLALMSGSFLAFVHHVSRTHTTAAFATASPTFV